MKVSNKNKLILLAIGTLLLVYLCYNWSFSKTISNYKEIATYKDYMATNGSYKTQIVQLQKEIKKYTSNGIVKNEDKKVAQDKLFQFISAYILKRNMRINQVPETIKSNMGGYDVETNLYKIQGDFHQLVSLVYEVEHHERLAKVSSLQIKKQLDRKTKKEYIEAAIYLQNIQ